MSFTSPAGSRWGDVYLAAGARAVSMCGDFVALVALTLTLQGRGAGGLAVAGILLGGAVPLAVLVPLTGRLVDRVDSRVLLCVTGLCQAAICARLAYASGTGEIIALVALLGTGLAVTQPTFSALVPSMVTGDDLPRASALGQTANTLGVLVAPALSGLLVGQFGLRVPLLLDAASYLALVGAGLAIRTRRRPGRSRRGRAASGTAAWRLRGDSLLSWQIAMSGAVIGAVGAINVIEVFFVRGTLHGSTTLYGLIGAAWTAGMIAGSWVVVRLGRTDARLAAATLGMLFAITVVGLAASTVPRAEWLLPLWTLGGACNGGLNVAIAVQLGRRVPAEARGRAYALLTGVINGANVIGYVIGGALLGVTSPRALFAATEAAGLLVVLAFAPPVLRAVRREASAPATPASALVPPASAPAVPEAAGADREPAHSAGARTVDNHERTATPPGGPHPVPELPADLLGSDAIGRAPRS